MSVHNDIKAKARKALEAFIKSGMSSKEALEKVQAQYIDDVVSVMANEINSLKIGKITPDRLKKMAVGSVDLSSNLYRHIQDVNASVLRTINTHAKDLNSARGLALKIYEGYGFQKDLIEVKKDIPKHLFQPLAEMDAKQLKTPALKAAYLQLLEAENEKQLIKALDVAMYERNRYLANRIAQTELHRIHTHQKVKEILADDGVEVVQIRLSATHPKVDICDYHANLDAYGLGKGCYPKDKAPMPPYHPFCKCRVSNRLDLSLSDAKPVRGDAEFKLMNSFNEGDQVKILGTKGMHERWLQGENTVVELVDLTKKPLYHTKYSGALSGAIIPDMEGNELLLANFKENAGRISGMKNSAKVLPNQTTWKDIDGLVDVRHVSNLSPQPVMHSKAGTRDEALELFKGVLGFSAGSVVVSSPVGEIQFHDEKLFHFVEKIDAARERFSSYVLDTLQDPHEVWLSEYDDGSFRHIFIGLFEGDNDFLVTTWVDDSGDMFWNAMQVKKKKNYLNNQRIGELKYKK